MNYLVPAIAVVVIGVVAIWCVQLTGDAEIAKIAISSIAGLVTGGVVGFAYGKHKSKKLDKPQA